VPRAAALDQRTPIGPWVKGRRASESHSVCLSPDEAGFAKEWEHQFEPGFPWFVSVARGNARLYLSEHKGDARPDTLIHPYVKDIDAVSEEFGTPVDEEGLAGRECDLIDPDGNRLRVATRRS
jgi:Glyoxalase superfamily protein